MDKIAASVLFIHRQPTILLAHVIVYIADENINLPSILFHASFQRSWPGHHLLAKTGLHHPVLWQEETLGHRSFNFNAHAEFSSQYHKRLSAYQRKFYKFVSGIAICGSGIGTFIFAPLTDWLLSSIHHPDVTINPHHDHHQAADHVLLANSAADLGRDLHGQLRLRTLLQAHPRMQGRANNDQILKQIMKKFWPIDSQFYYHDAHRILRLRLARLCCL